MLRECVCVATHLLYVDLRVAQRNLWTLALSTGAARRTTSAIQGGTHCVEAKYTRLYAPIFSRRGEIITGKAGSKTELMVRTKAAVRENDLVWCRPRFRGRFCTQAEENDLQTQLKIIPACGAGDKRDTIGVGAIVGQNETVLLAVRLSGGNHLKCQFSVCFLRWNSQRL